jgi:hypothetical protein
MTDPVAAPPPPPPPPPSSGVVVRPKVFFFSFILLLFKVHLSVDGGPPFIVGWNENFIPLPPGQHSLRCWLPYLFYRQMGDSTVSVDVAPGALVKAQWRTPWLVFLQGKWTVTAASA